MFLLKIALKWSEFHKFFPFQLPFEESLVYSSDYDLKLFVPSAFARNIDYKKLKEELALFKKEKDNLIFLLNLSKERREIEKIKESIKDADKKAFDTIAVFTASITFLFGTINIFMNNTTLGISMLISNTVGLGVLLLLFMSLYLLFSPLLLQKINWRKYLSTGRFLFGAIGLLFISLLVYFLYKNNQIISTNSDKPSIEVKRGKTLNSNDSILQKRKHTI